MIRFLLAVFLAASLTGPARAQTDAVQGVIAGQIDAFQRDDFDTAFGFASPMIRRIFRTPENFGLMVQRGFPMVWRPADVQYLGQHEADGFTYQQVLIRDANGTYFTLQYQMIAGPDGWQINGVEFLETTEFAA